MSKRRNKKQSPAKAAIKAALEIAQQHAQLLAPTTTGTPNSTDERSSGTPEIDWATLSDDQLGGTITDSFLKLELLSSQAQKEMRERLLPALREVKQRFESGQLVGGFKGLAEFYRSIGINTATVRKWEFRARREAARLMMPESATHTDDDEAMGELIEAAMTEAAMTEEEKEAYRDSVRRARKRADQRFAKDLAITKRLYSEDLDRAKERFDRRLKKDTTNSIHLFSEDMRRLELPTHTQVVQ